MTRYLKTRSVGIQDERLQRLIQLIEEGNLEDVKNHVRTSNITREQLMQWDRGNMGFDHKAPIITAAESGTPDIMLYMISKTFGSRTAFLNVDAWYTFYLIQTAARRGHANIIQKIVEEFGHKVDFFGRFLGDLNLAFDAAVGNGRYEVVKYLVENGFPVNEKRSQVMTTPLYNAAASYQPEICKYLISQGADIHEQFRGDSLVQRLAACDAATLEVFLDAGVDVDTTNSDGETLFMQSTIAGKIENMRLLIRRGADLLKMDEYQETALWKGIARGRTEVIQFLLTEANLNPDIDGTDMFFLDCVQVVGYEKSLRILKLLVASGYRMEKGWYAIMEEHFHTDGTDSFHQLMSYVRNMLVTPRTLKESATLMIRHILGTNIDKASSLSIPQTLVDMIQLKHVTV